MYPKKQAVHCLATPTHFRFGSYDPLWWTQYRWRSVIGLDRMAWIIGSQVAGGHFDHSLHVDQDGGTGISFGAISWGRCSSSFGSPIWNNFIASEYRFSMLKSSIGSRSAKIDILRSSSMADISGRRWSGIAIQLQWNSYVIHLSHAPGSPIYTYMTSIRIRVGRGLLVIGVCWSPRYNSSIARKQHSEVTSCLFVHFLCIMIINYLWYKVKVVSAASDSTLKQLTTCGVSNTCTLLFFTVMTICIMANKSKYFRSFFF